MVTDEETGAEIAVSSGGPITQPLNVESAKVARVVGPGAECQFTFDLGDDWIRRCVRPARPHPMLLHAWPGPN